MQRNCEQAMNFFERKVVEMKARIDEVGEDLRGREHALQQVEALFQQRLAEAKAQEQSQASKDALA
jgi:prefoldin subunit 5